MKREDIISQLSGVSIPAFDYPWPEACSPYAQAVEEQMIQWAESYNLFLNNEHRRRASENRYGWLAARCYPRADRELLQAIADYFIWFFSVDDVFVDYIETVAENTLQNLTAVIDVLDYGKTGKELVYGELAWLDITTRLRSLLGPEPFERFAQGMRLWATTSGLQIINDMHSESVGVRQYETIRRYTGGMIPCLALTEVANGGSVRADHHHRTDVRRLCQLVNNIITWSNDVQSFAAEILQPGRCWNMVVVRASEGYSLQQSVDYTAARVNSEMSQFIKLSDEIINHDGQDLVNFIDGMKYWLRGTQDWFQKDTLRYTISTATEDMNDCGMLSFGDE